MRPGGFSPRSVAGNLPPADAINPFNEAGGILPPEWVAEALTRFRQEYPPSMRPGGFSPRSGSSAAARRSRPAPLQ